MCTLGPTIRCANRGVFPGTPGKTAQSRSISRVLSWTVIPLGASSPIRSSNLPGDTAGRGIVSLFGLAPGGVCRAGPLPDSRCALTAPFHPCPHPEGPLAVSFCCTFRRLAPPRRYLAPCPVEPGLSSACVPPKRERMTRLSDRLCAAIVARTAPPLRRVSHRPSRETLRARGCATLGPSAVDRPPATTGRPFPPAVARIMPGRRHRPMRGTPIADCARSTRHPGDDRRRSAQNIPPVA